MPTLNTVTDTPPRNQHYQSTNNTNAWLTK